MNLPYSESCERNKKPILDVLLRILPAVGTVLEIGSCTGQHVVYFAPRFPGLSWQPSDRQEYLQGLGSRIRLEGSGNILTPVRLNVLDSWPQCEFDAAYSANTSHIMGWQAVCAMFEGVSAHLRPGGLFCLYGPFNRDGEFTSPSNADFDQQLRARDPHMGIRDIADLASLANSHHMSLEQGFELPANNQMLVFRRNDVSNAGK